MNLTNMTGIEPASVATAPAVAGTIVNTATAVNVGTRTVDSGATATVTAIVKSSGVTHRVSSFAFLIAMTFAIAATAGSF
jgi:hypothetical protein